MLCQGLGALGATCWELRVLWVPYAESWGIWVPCAGGWGLWELHAGSWGLWMPRGSTGELCMLLAGS